MASLQQRLSRLAPSVQTKLYSLFDKGTVSEFCSRGQNGGQNGGAAALVLVSLTTSRQAWVGFKGYTGLTDNHTSAWCWQQRQSVASKFLPSHRQVLKS